MKKISFFTILLSLSVLLTDCWAQTSVVAHANMPFPIERTIIREHNFPSTVSFVELEKRGYFVYADTTYTATYLPIDSNFFVNDFVIEDDTVFFCGNNSNGDGFIGFFDINDFFFGSNSYFLNDNILSAVQGKVVVLSKLVSYVDVVPRRNIVAIGVTASGQKCVVNMVYDAAASTWRYKTGEIPATSPETMLEICKTDNNVVTAGLYYEDPDNPDIVLRAYDRNSIFNSANSIQNYANKIYDVTLQHSFCLGQVKLLQMSCDRIGVAAFWKNHQEPDTLTPRVLQLPQGTYVGRYAVSQPKDIFQHQNSILVPHVYTNGGWNLFGFSKYNLSTNTFNLLLECEENYSGINQSVVYELSDIILNGATLFYYATTNPYRFQSIDGYYTTSNYLMNGYDVGNKMKLVYNLGQQGANGCLKNYKIQPQVIDMTDSPVLCPFSVTLLIDVKLKRYKSLGKEEKVNVDCEKF